MYIFARRALKFLALASAFSTGAIAQPAPTPTPIKMAMIEGLSGPFANTGEAVFRNLIWAVERVNARGGVTMPAAHGSIAVARPMALARYDSKGQNEEALTALKSAIDDGAQFIMQ
ncbi:MAG: branched-chain amino acid ABC transporter substrate-binding protein, partial [Rhodoferax sp.]|nr:branched-chain amino acid ABC transporter substrate-binding protein [Rhodoferax sp.]